MREPERQDKLHVLVELLSSDLRTGAANDCLDLLTFADQLGLRITFCGCLEQAFLMEAHRRGASTIPSRSVMLSRTGMAGYAASVVAWFVRLRTLRPSIVHLDYTGWAPSLALAARLARTPVVGRAGPYIPGNRANAWIDAYAANCKPHAAALLDSPLAHRVWITGSLFRLDRLAAPFERAAPLPPRTPGRARFLFLGQLVERKGLRILVEGFSRMQVPADLLIVGGNWSDAGFPQELKQEVAQLGLSDRIFLENHRLDVAALLDDCDVFVLPSLSEARPRSIIEAMFLGKPVLASAVGGIPTLVEDGVTGVLVPPGNVEALARALDGLAANAGLRGRLGASAHEWAHSEVRPETAAARLAELYRRLAGGQGLGTSSVSKRPPGC